MAGPNTQQRHLKQFVFVGRSGKKFYVYGISGDMHGPYDTHQEADSVRRRIIDNYEDYEIVDRVVVRKK